MVNINYDLSKHGTTATITCPEKTKATFSIIKDNSGYIFFDIHIDKGQLPKELKGKFSGIPQALRVVSEYLRGVKASPTVRRDNYGDEVDKTMKAAKDNDTKDKPKGN